MVFYTTVIIVDLVGVSMLKKTHIKILEDRGISIEMVSNLGWSSVEKTANGKDVIRIPYFRDGKTVGLKFRTISGEKLFYQEKSSEQCLYNLDVLKTITDEEPLVITEGEMDCVIALQCGFNAVSVPNGAPSRPIEGDAAKKFNYLSEIPPKRIITLAVDADIPGGILLNEIAKRHGRAFCKWVRYPDGCKDLNDVFLQHGEKAVYKIISGAEWVKVDGLYNMGAIPPAAEHQAFDCCVDGLGENYKIRAGDLTVVTGIPSHGKTMLVNEIACNMAKAYNWNICIGSFEQSPKPDHQRYLRNYFLRKPPRLFAVGTPETNEAFSKADSWIDDHFWFVIPDIDSEESISLDWALERCAHAILRHGCRLVILDPWNELDHFRPSGMSLTEYTGWAIKQLKIFARKYQVHVIVVAHPAKLEKNKDGSYSVPTLYDISDSSHWYNKPDVGIVVYRSPWMVNLIRVAKVRYVGTIGAPGDVFVRLDQFLGQFVSVSFEEAKELEEEWRKNTSSGFKKTVPQSFSDHVERAYRKK